MRVKVVEEEQGLDITFHGGFAYDQGNGNSETSIKLLRFAKSYVVCK